MDLSIIIVSYNTRQVLHDCLTSIAKFETSKDLTYEIIVVDNGSTDDSPQHIAKHFPKVHLIRNSQNLGFASANNQGIQQSRGDYILLLNSDTVLLHKNTFQQLLAAAHTHRSLGALVPKLLNHDHSPQASAYRFPTITNAIREYWFGQPHAYSKYLPNQTYITTLDVAVMAAFLIPRTVIDQIGPLDQTYFMYFEDFEFCRRLSEANLRIYYHPEIEILHLHGASGKSTAPDVHQWKRLIPSSKKYHGLFIHYLLYFILWTSQKLQFNKSKSS